MRWVVCDCFVCTAARLFDAIEGEWRRLATLARRAPGPNTARILISDLSRPS